MINSGTRLSHYEIISPIGAGGMGEVYRARDTRLDRIVAIKVLPDHLASNSELRQRFEREARAVSSLNHPPICTLHDIGSQDGIDYPVMELIEGESLADRLIKVSQEGGSEPRWSSDGKEFFYFDRENRLAAVEVNPSARAFEAGATKILFQLHSKGWYARYDVAPDGKRFLVTTVLDDQHPSLITLVANWQRMLKR